MVTINDQAMSAAAHLRTIGTRKIKPLPPNDS
jgi:hypothetical protein